VRSAPKLGEAPSPFISPQLPTGSTDCQRVPAPSTSPMMGKVGAQRREGVAPAGSACGFQLPESSMEALCCTAAVSRGRDAHYCAPPRADLGVRIYRTGLLSRVDGCAIRGLGDPYSSTAGPGGALGTTHPAQGPDRAVPPGLSLDQAPSLHPLCDRGARACSTTSLVRRTCPTSRRRTSSAMAQCLPEADQTADGPVVGGEISRFPHKQRPCMHRVSDLAGPIRRSRWRGGSCGLPLEGGRRPGLRFRGSIPSLHAPLPTLRRGRRRPRRTARGRCGSLLLHRSALAPPTPCRLLPAHLTLTLPRPCEGGNRQSVKFGSRLPSPAARP
jgi:hypothetical protein